MKLLLLVLLVLSPMVGNRIQAQSETPPSCVITYPHTNAYYQAGTDLLIRYIRLESGEADLSALLKRWCFMWMGISCMRHRPIPSVPILFCGRIWKLEATELLPVPSMTNRLILFRPVYWLLWVQMLL
ncbi:hypothetical protein [Geofilum rubicundum]|uniref:hypothetical protein n=1 Tax=Geofilum rubicundum TaxID=472113 RepID=UPI0012F9B425|nr:hypothetical protein [Geofilum rubicundum]